MSNRKSNTPSLVVLCSGEGTNLRAIHNSIQNNIIVADISCVIINNSSAGAVDYCKNNDIHFKILEYDKENMTRDEYDSMLRNSVQSYNPYLVVLAGWMHIVSSAFIRCFEHIINIHPALPGTFVGVDCIRKAYDSFGRGEIKHTGVMVHKVIEEVDKGEVLEQIVVPINSDDTFETLEKRVKLYEKGVLISAIQKYVSKNSSSCLNSSKIYKGKVRQVEDIGYNCLLLKASNRISAFDRHLCDIQNKGVILNKISEYWFQNTRHIIDNHFLYSKGNMMIVKKCKPIKLEFVVRGYMTGSSSTSIWTHYKNGKRNIYGLNFRDGYVKNQKLDELVVTPTTKGTTDHPITKEEIIEEYLTEEQCEFIYSKALELFRYGQAQCSEKGLLLVDTKYEFGFYEGKIILMDEVHTCDSSRFWLEKTYNERMQAGSEPEKLDKDVIRDWVKSNCDPYNMSTPIPEIPSELKQHVSDVYATYYNMITGSNNENLTTLSLSADELEAVCSTNFINDYFNNENKHLAIIFAGSVSDKFHVEKIKGKLKNYNIYSHNHYCSAHKQTSRLLDIMKEYEKQEKNIVYITCAGMSNALSGVVACNTRHPVIACPVFKDSVDMTVNINSSLQCPSKVPVMTVLQAENVAMCIKRIWQTV